MFFGAAAAECAVHVPVENDKNLSSGDLKLRFYWCRFGWTGLRPIRVERSGSGYLWGGGRRSLRQCRHRPPSAVCARGEAACWCRSHRDRLDGSGLGFAEIVEERFECDCGAVLGPPDDLAGIVVDDQGQVLVSAFPGDLVHADVNQPGRARTTPLSWVRHVRRRWRRCATRRGKAPMPRSTPSTRRTTRSGSRTDG